MPEFAPRVIRDPVWGDTEISEPVLLKLIDSPTVKRTAGISQLGLPQQYHYLTTFSRESHNIGTMLCVRRLGGSVEEQASAVLHDTSHSAFSHVIDWVLKSYGKDDHQDSIHRNYLNQTEIPGILAKYGLYFGRVVDYGDFPLLEQPTPRLCADRVDYALREMKVSGFDPEIVPVCVSGLTTFQDRLVFDNPKAASLFGWGFLKLLRQDWGNHETMARFMIFSNILRDAMDQRIIDMDDFYVDDAHVLDKIFQNGDEDIIRRIQSMRNRLEEMPDLRVIKGQVVKYKFRYVDPEYLEGGDLVKLTEADPDYLTAINFERQVADKGVVI